MYPSGGQNLDQQKGAPNKGTNMNTSNNQQSPQRTGQHVDYRREEYENPLVPQQHGQMSEQHIPSSSSGAPRKKSHRPRAVANPDLGVKLLELLTEVSDGMRQNEASQQSSNTNNKGNNSAGPTDDPEINRLIAEALASSQNDSKRQQNSNQDDNTRINVNNPQISARDYEEIRQKALYDEQRNNSAGSGAQQQQQHSSGTNLKAPIANNNSATGQKNAQASGNEMDELAVALTIAARLMHDGQQQENNSSNTAGGASNQQASSSNQQSNNLRNPDLVYKHRTGLQQNLNVLGSSNNNPSSSSSNHTGLIEHLTRSQQMAQKKHERDDETDFFKNSLLQGSMRGKNYEPGYGGSEYMASYRDAAPYFRSNRMSSYTYPMRGHHGNTASGSEDAHEASLLDYEQKQHAFSATASPHSHYNPPPRNVRSASASAVQQGVNVFDKGGSVLPPGLDNSYGAIQNSQGKSYASSQYGSDHNSYNAASQTGPHGQQRELSPFGVENPAYGASAQQTREQFERDQKAAHERAFHEHMIERHYAMREREYQEKLLYRAQSQQKGGSNSNPNVFGNRSAPMSTNHHSIAGHSTSIVPAPPGYAGPGASSSQYPGGKSDRYDNAGARGYDANNWGATSNNYYDPNYTMSAPLNRSMPQNFGRNNFFALQQQQQRMYMQQMQAQNFRGGKQIDKTQRKKRSKVILQSSGSTGGMGHNPHMMSKTLSSDFDRGASIYHHTGSNEKAECNETCLMLKNIPNRFRPFAIMNLVFCNDIIRKDDILQGLVEAERENRRKRGDVSGSVLQSIEKAKAVFSWTTMVSKERVDEMNRQHNNPNPTGVHGMNYVVPSTIQQPHSGTTSNTSDKEFTTDGLPLPLPLSGTESETVKNTTSGDNAQQSSTSDIDPQENPFRDIPPSVEASLESSVDPLSDRVDSKPEGKDASEQVVTLNKEGGATNSGENSSSSQQLLSRGPNLIQISRNPNSKQLSGPWDAICAEGVRSDTLVSLLSAELDPAVLDYIDFFHQPQNLKGFNLGYAFANFRTKALADRFIELLNNYGFPSNSRKSLELLLSQARPLYKPMDVEDADKPGKEGNLSKRKRLRLATRFWFDHEQFPITCSVESATGGSPQGLGAKKSPGIGALIGNESTTSQLVGDLVSMLGSLTGGLQNVPSDGAASNNVTSSPIRTTSNGLVLQAVADALGTNVAAATSSSTTAGDNLDAGDGNADDRGA